MKTNIKIDNRKAKYDYFIEKTIECGISLSGNEIKSIRNGLCSLKESYAAIENHEVYLKQCHITKYSSANAFDVDENRNRKLLLHKKEILMLENDIKMLGYTLIPLQIYFTDNHKCKCLLGLCKGKKNYDKRNSLKERTMKRDIERFK